MMMPGYSELNLLEWDDPTGKHVTSGLLQRHGMYWHMRLWARNPKRYSAYLAPNRRLNFGRVVFYDGTRKRL